MLNLVFFGRFEREKGFDLLCESAREWKKQNMPFCLFLFGRGSVMPFFTQDLRTLSDAEVLQVEPKRGEVFYFGQRDPIRVIRPFMEKHMDYALMPSRCLETFGLSAVEAMAAGVPVVGPCEGGLRAVGPLVVDLKEVPHLPKPSAALRAALKKRAADFAPQVWLKNLQKLLPAGTKKILLVSDFLEPIGGTELHVLELENYLKQSGYEVQLFGSNKAPKPRILGLLFALWNPLYLRRLQLVLQRFQPDLVWTHSTIRFLGPGVLRSILKAPTFTMHTVHDLGLFTPYPSRIQRENELVKPLSWRVFSRSLMTLCKYFFLVKPTLRCLQKFNVVLVPADFMKALLPKAKVLAHFVK